MILKELSTVIRIVMLFADSDLNVNNYKQINQIYQDT